MTQNNPVFTTKIEQAYIVVAKDQFVVMADAFYGDTIENQAPLTVMPAIVSDRNGSDVTRINALNAIVTLMRNIPADYDRFINVYGPSLVESNQDNAVNWIQHFKQAIQHAYDVAEHNGVEPEVVEQLNIPYYQNQKKQDRFVTAGEIDLWAEFFALKGEKPFINVRNVGKATEGFTDVRAAINDVLVKRAYDKLKEIGGDINDKSPASVSTRTGRIRMNIGATPSQEELANVQ